MLQSRQSGKNEGKITAIETVEHCFENVPQLFLHFLGEPLAAENL